MACFLLWQHGRGPFQDPYRRDAKLGKAIVSGAAEKIFLRFFTHECFFISLLRLHAPSIFTRLRREHRLFLGLNNLYRSSSIIFSVNWALGLWGSGCLHRHSFLKQQSAPNWSTLPRHHLVTPLVMHGDSSLLTVSMNSSLPT